MLKLQNLFGRNQIPLPRSQTTHNRLPSDPDFDIDVWMAEVREIEEKHPDSPGVQEMRAIGMGFSDCITPEEKAEQARRWDEMISREEEAKRSATTSQHRAS